MNLEIVQYGHPALRAKGKVVGEVDARIRQLASDMIETMNEAEGVGLAAQQVGVPMQMCVLDVRDIPKRPSRMWIGANEVEVEDFMPMVLLNPVVEASGELETEVEGCLSFPGILGDITRLEKVRVQAKDLDGNPVEFEAAGLLARAVQHEHDHLHGVLFIDRMDEAERRRTHAGVAKLSGM